MKKLLIWLGLGVVVFIVLVGAIFGVLTYMQSKDEPAEVEQLTENGTVNPEILAQKQAEIDTLNAEIARIKGELFNTKLVSDSLLNNNQFLEGLLSEYKTTVADLNGKLLKKQKQAVKIKELAKTYESMKVDEIRPILKNVDDMTVIALYENMSSRSKKVILNSLSSERAALITQQLAGMDANDKE
ncbi:MAG: hypothetical protein GXO91_05050 [FCB group bacterium]|nr:hypothetical protein [FCB group bacterium]